MICMRQYIFKHIPLILAAAGFVFSLINVLPVKYSHGYFFHVVLTMITVIYVLGGLALGLLVKRLYQNSYRDILTGLLNKRYFNMKLIDDLARVKRNKHLLSLLIIDIDNFKSINDTYGHVFGDNVLKQLAVIFEASIRKSDTVVRWGGEEFAIILSDTALDGAYSLAERIREEVESYRFYSDNASCRITVSIGVASAKENMNPDVFVRMADRALYMAKRQKNMVMSA